MTDAAPPKYWQVLRARTVALRLSTRRVSATCARRRGHRPPPPDTVLRRPVLSPSGPVRWLCSGDREAAERGVPVRREGTARHGRTAYAQARLPRDWRADA